MLLCLAPVCMLLDEAANYVVALLGGRCLVFLYFEQNVWCFWVTQLLLGLFFFWRQPNTQILYIGLSGLRTG